MRGWAVDAVVWNSLTTVYMLTCCCCPWLTHLAHMITPLYTFTVLTMLCYAPSVPIFLVHSDACQILNIENCVIVYHLTHVDSSDTWNCQNWTRKVKVHRESQTYKWCVNAEGEKRWIWWTDTWRTNAMPYMSWTHYQDRIPHLLKFSIVIETESTRFDSS